MNDWPESTEQHQKLVLHRDEQSDQPYEPNRTDVISHDVYIWALIDGFLVVAILSGNILTILAVRFSRRLRSLISNLFILSLAISDMVVGLTLPYHLAFYLGIGLGDNKFLCILRFFLLILACCVSIWNLIAIAVDRYIAICYPLHYSR
jgi:muscarinic acetylcholine receptor